MNLKKEFEDYILCATEYTKQTMISILDDLAFNSKHRIVSMKKLEGIEKQQFANFCGILYSDKENWIQIGIEDINCTVYMTIKEEGLWRMFTNPFLRKQLKRFLENSKLNTQNNCLEIKR